MAANSGGEATRQLHRELARERHEHAVALVDGEAIRRALGGCPVALTELERGVVIAIADTDGIDREVAAAGLGMSRGALDWAILRARKRVPVLTRDLQAAVMLRPAAVLVGAVEAGDADAVAGVLAGLDAQRLAALAVVLAAAVTDRGVLPGIPEPEHSCT